MAEIYHAMYYEPSDGARLDLDHAEWLSLDEVAEILGLPAPTVRSRFASACRGGPYHEAGLAAFSRRKIRVRRGGKFSLAANYVYPVNDIIPVVIDAPPPGRRPSRQE